MRKFRDLTGLTFGRWTVLGGFKVINRVSFWHCRCSCGVEKKLMRAADLVRGSSKSCGCYNVEVSRARFTTHGKSSTRTHKIWRLMLDRCSNPNNPVYKWYGGRGIKICKRWLKFENFYADLGDPPSLGHSIDRINNDKGYDPKNCRWATDIEQANNKKTNRYLFLNGERLTMAQVARKYSVDYRLIQRRLNRGISIQQILKENA